MHESKPDDMFQIDPKIISAKIGTVRGETLFNQSREARDSLEPRQHTLLKLPAEFLTEMNSRMPSADERAEFVLISYGNQYGLIIPRGERYLLLAVEKTATPEELMRIAGAVKSIQVW